MFKLTDRQQFAYDQILMGRNVFITGPGGVGKSVLVNTIRENMGNDTIFLAPTGIAALNINGSTIHRQFGFPIGFISKSRADHVKDSVIDLLSDKTSVNRIVIDEISMVRADVFNAINRQCQKARKSRKPFGGLQIVLVGDFFQLPPVLNNKSSEYSFYTQEYDSLYAFSTDAWSDAGFQTIELTEVLRTTECDFISLLQSIRQKDSNYKIAVDAFNDLCYNKFDNAEEDAILLTTTNKNADEVNSLNLNDLPSPIKTFHVKKTGDVKIEPAPSELNLKEGARVMMIANSYEEGFMNGELGYVVEINKDNIMVLIDGRHFPTKVTPYKWIEQEYFAKSDGGFELRQAGTFTQYPIKLAYAITIHKSQGVSLSSAHINLGNGAFSHGQTYVALSRLRSINKLNLMNKLQYKDIIVDKEVVQFYEDNRNSSLLNF